MAQFTVYRNTNPRTKKAIPFLLDVQHDLMEHLATRVVVPLARQAVVRNKPVRHLNPVVEVDGQSVVMLTQEMAGVRKQILGEAVADLADRRVEILGAIGFLVTGA